ncbi:hypothetical protein [Amycolatopsis sp. H20-H5]|uniref:hypothetical protein n=1 Tax=Amycolatopsis sp. H20-H5 TaxID=3046309 RepID=UPI002DB8B1D6|nr:hypothetical protein [Amycolatopsis sp. H20-H5]MEC3974333.1 hypothetical protein [Amycolatopsis sp. H20-H5]
MDVIFSLADRAKEAPLCPGRRVLQRPLLKIPIEATDLEEDGVVTLPRTAASVFPGDRLRAFPPDRGDVVGEVEDVDVGVMVLDVSPEVANEDADQVLEAAVVECGAAFVEVAHEHISHRMAPDAAGVHQFRSRPLPVTHRVLERCVFPEVACGDDQVRCDIAQVQALLVAWVQGRTSSYVTGVETVGWSRPRREYGATGHVAVQLILRTRPV